MKQVFLNCLFSNFLFLILGICLILKSENICAQCAGTETYTSNPAPSANTYFTGTTVTFCYTIAGFSQNGANWLDGLIITLGPGWDAASLTPVQIPFSCDGMGQWLWEQSVVSSANGGTYGPGFFYDWNFDADLDPGNDFGDYTVTGVCQWTMCFSVAVNPACTSSDLSIYITAAGDGTVGSWANASCPGIPFPISTATCAVNCSNYSTAVSGIDPGCSGTDGSVSSVTLGGTAPYTYQWSSPGSATSFMNNLSAGTYVLTVVDINNCSAVDSVTLFQSPILSVSTVPSSVTCNGGANGTVNSNVVGGVFPFTYLWSNGATTANISSVVAGTYTVTVTDAAGCTSVSSSTVTQPVAVSLSSIITDASCQGFCDGAISISVSNGQAPYMYQWSGGLPPLNNPTNLCIGNYQLTVTDANLCTATGTYNVSGPLGMTLTMNHTDAICNGSCDGTAGVIVNSGIAPYSFLWGNGSTNSTVNNLCTGNFFVSVTDAIGCTTQGSVIVSQPVSIIVNPASLSISCNGLSDGMAFFSQTNAVLPYSVLWSTGGTTDTLYNLFAGYYSLTLTDANGCIDTAGVTVTEPTMLSLVVNATGESCPGVGNGMVTANPSGGTSPYFYNWNNPPGQSASSLTNLPQDYYDVIVTDVNGCTITGGDSVLLSPLFLVDADGDTTLINGEMTELIVHASGGGNYIYAWSPDITVLNPYSFNPTVKPVVTTTYTVLVTDPSTGCFNTDSVIVIVLPTSYLYVPNAFSPNGDGINDIFECKKGEAVSISEVQIYNRWGQVVYRQPEDAWNGNAPDEHPCSVGVYAYCIWYKIEGDASTYRQVGNVTLVR